MWLLSLLLLVAFFELIYTCVPLDDRGRLGVEVHLGLDNYLFEREVSH